MFIIELSYKKALDVIDKHLEAHRAYLDEGYKNNYFLVSGPKTPRTGGIIIIQIFLHSLKHHNTTLRMRFSYELSIKNRHTRKKSS